MLVLITGLSLALFGGFVGLVLGTRSYSQRITKQVNGLHQRVVDSRAEMERILDNKFLDKMKDVDLRLEKLEIRPKIGRPKKVK